MDKNETIGPVACFSGSIATSCSAQAALMTESNILLIFSGLGALCAVAGLMYTVWNGNRNFKLQQKALEISLALKALPTKDQNNG